jgi:hypothetical protein
MERKRSELLIRELEVSLRELPGTTTQLFFDEASLWGLWVTRENRRWGLELLSDDEYRLAEWVDSPIGEKANWYLTVASFQLVVDRLWQELWGPCNTRPIEDA